MRRKGELALSKKWGLGLILLLLASLSITGCQSLCRSFAPAASTDPAAGLTRSAVAFRFEQRMLWGQHLEWNRMLMLSILENLPDQAEVTARLVRNQQDMVESLQPLYGNEPAEQFGRLLDNHTAITIELIKAQKAGDAAASRLIEERWYRNADALAGFLSTINPNWPQKPIAAMLKQYLTLIQAELTARLAKDYAGDIAAYDKLEIQAFRMADGLAEGIIKQFPDKFR